MDLTAFLAECLHVQGVFLFDIGFLKLRIWDLLDVLIVSYLIYRIIKLLRGSIAFQIFIAMVLLYVVWWIVKALNMPLLSGLLSQFVSLGMILLIIIFQPEIRRFLIDIGETTLNRRSRLIRRLIPDMGTRYADHERVEAILLEAILNMSRSRTGALIVLNNNNDPSLQAKGGSIINAQIQNGLLESIFHKDSALHDGAVIIQNNRLHKSSAVLPVSDNQHLPKSVGLRHRAGVGVTEHANVAAIIVSETDGTISTCFKGKLQRDISEESLISFLAEHM